MATKGDDKKITHNGRVAYQLKRLTEEIAKYPKDSLASSLANLGAAWNEYGYVYDKMKKKGGE